VFRLQEKFHLLEMGAGEPRSRSGQQSILIESPAAGRKLGKTGTELYI
jgi:hypothetical protein